MKIKGFNHFHAHYSLFHHDISEYMDGGSNLSDAQLEFLKQKPSAGEKDVSNILIEILKENLDGIQNHEIGLTLTGGFDSRVVLSALLALGKTPICFTYGNPQNRDIKIASKICKKFDLKHINVASIPAESESYLRDAKETLRIDQGNSHLHRSHRMLAIKQFTAKNNIKVLFTGHFGGEQIRGLVYNNYFSSSLFEQFNENDVKTLDLIEPILKSYFIRDDYYNKEQLINEIMNLSWMKNNTANNRLYYLYDLVGMNHHMQDIRLYSKFVAKVIPVYLDKRFIEVLMKSPHHFMRKKRNRLNSLSHPKLYYSIIDRFCPELLKIELSNRYKPTDYAKGLVFYAMKRVINKYLVTKHTPPSFSYGAWYVKFIKDNAERVDERIWEIYDKKAYFHALNNATHESNEGYWHKFSNPIFFDLKNKSI